jgi:transcriptional regulator with XRE-family HTH domain
VIGQQLRTARRAAGLTQYQLADLLGIDQSVVSVLESDNSNPRWSTIERVLEALGARPAIMVTPLAGGRLDSGR